MTLQRTIAYCWWATAPLLFALPLLFCSSGTACENIAGVAFTQSIAAAMRSSSAGARLFKVYSAIFDDLLWLYASAYALAWALSATLGRLRLRFVETPPPLRTIFAEIARSLTGVATGALVFTAVVMLSRAPALDLSDAAWSAVLVPWALALPLWGDLHFYVTHRALHSVPSLYSAVHKLHHRSVNTHVSSSLSMHPLEHVVYFSSLAIGVALPVPLHALRLLSFGLILNPIPSHIACWPWEHHHWEHHTHFAFNYGSSALFDTVFGTTHAAYVARRSASGSSGGGGAVARAWDSANVRVAAEQARLAGARLAGARLAGAPFERVRI